DGVRLPGERGQCVAQNPGLGEFLGADGDSFSSAGGGGVDKGRGEGEKGGDGAMLHATASAFSEQGVRWARMDSGTNAAGGGAVCARRSGGLPRCRMGPLRMGPIQSPR